MSYFQDHSVKNIFYWKINRNAKHCFKENIFHIHKMVQIYFLYKIYSGYCIVLEVKSPLFNGWDFCLVNKLHKYDCSLGRSAAKVN